MSLWQCPIDRRAGEIRVDMFQELLLADFVVVDLSIENPNVWYELGVRDALSTCQTNIKLTVSFKTCSCRSQKIVLKRRQQ
jgi:hypothetical protein